MIKASDVLGYDRAKWAKKQPHKDLNIHWTKHYLKDGTIGEHTFYTAVDGR